MKIAFTSKGEGMDSAIEPRFGRAEYLVTYDEATGDTEVFDNGSISEVAHGAGPQTAQKLIQMGADVLITGNGPGGNANAVLEKTDIKVFVGADGMTLSKAYEEYKQDNLKEV